MQNGLTIDNLLSISDHHCNEGERNGEESKTNILQDKYNHVLDRT